MTIRWGRAGRIAGLALAATSVMALLASAARPPVPEPLPPDLGLGPVADSVPAPAPDGAGGSWDFRWPEPRRSERQPKPPARRPNARRPERQSAGPAPAAELLPVRTPPQPPPAAAAAPAPAVPPLAQAPPPPALPESTPSEFGFEH